MGRDYFTEDGAHLIKKKIEAYWRDRGMKVEVNIKKGGFVSALRMSRVDVRSDMINGFPSKPLTEDIQY